MEQKRAMLFGLMLSRDVCAGSVILPSNILAVLWADLRYGAAACLVNRVVCPHEGHKHFHRCAGGFISHRNASYTQIWARASMSLPSLLRHHVA